MCLPFSQAAHGANPQEIGGDPPNRERNPYRFSLALRRSLAVAVLSVALIPAGAIPANASSADSIAISAKKRKKLVSGAYGGTNSQGGSLSFIVSKERAKFPPLNLALACISSTGETGTEVQTVGPFSLKISKRRIDGTRSFNGGTLTVDGKFSGKSFSGSLTFSGTTMGGSGLPAGSPCVTSPPVGLIAAKLPKF
jgi:hypothetical protein